MSVSSLAGDIAGMMKERENPNPLGVCTGVIVAPFPDIKIQLPNGVSLDKSYFIFTASVLSGYRRKFKITTASPGPTDPVGSYKLSNKNTNPTQSMVEFELGSDPKAICEIELTDTLQPGDKVMLVPTTDEQRYYVSDWVVEL